MMNFHDQDRPCHPERSEDDSFALFQTLVPILIMKTHIAHYTKKETGQFS